MTDPTPPSQPEPLPPQPPPAPAYPAAGSPTAGSPAPGYPTAGSPAPGYPAYGYPTYVDPLYADPLYVDPLYVDPLAKSRVTAGLLGIFLGQFGVHRFYLGYTSIGVLQILVTIATCGIGGLWGFIEGILILTGSAIKTDADGRPLRQ